MAKIVAIPLEQGLFFNGNKSCICNNRYCRNPFGAVTIF